jgi:DNA-binding PadR family transcriptional regulator
VTVLELALLRELRCSGEQTAPALAEHVRAWHPHGFWLISVRVYPALRHLEREGYVASRDSEPVAERGWRPRAYYSITDKGREIA